MTAEAVEAELHRARAARRVRDGAAVIEAVDAAWARAEGLRPDHPLRVRVGWKRAKAHADFGGTEGALAALAPILEREDLFDAWPDAARGAPRLARLHQDRRGYGDGRVIALWTRWAEHHRARGDLVPWALGRIQLAWDAGVRDLPDRAAELLDPVHQLTQADLLAGATRYQAAADAASSVFHIHLEAAHTALRPAIWAGDRAAVDAAMSTLEVAQDDLGQPRSLLIAEALQEAHLHFGTAAPRGYAELLEGAEGFRAAYGRGLRTGDLAEARRLGPAEGPEWDLAVRLAASRAGLDADALDLATRTGCAVFVRRAQAGAITLR